MEHKNIITEKGNKLEIENATKANGEKERNFKLKMHGMRGLCGEMSLNKGKSERRMWWQTKIVVCVWPEMEEKDKDQCIAHGFITQFAMAMTMNESNNKISASLRNQVQIYS